MGYAMARDQGESSGKKERGGPEDRLSAHVPREASLAQSLWFPFSRPLLLTFSL